MPDNAATKTLLNDTFWDSLKKDINGDNVSRICHITRARGNATNVPPKKE
jgi:hypothetical protein